MCEEYFRDVSVFKRVVLPEYGWQPLLLGSAHIVPNTCLHVNVQNQVKYQLTCFQNLYSQLKVNVGVTAFYSSLILKFLMIVDKLVILITFNVGASLATGLLYLIICELETMRLLLME